MRFRYEVIVDTDTLDHANQVMAERLTYDEQYEDDKGVEFEYEIDYREGKANEPPCTAFIHHGPGHQTTSECSGKHWINDEGKVVHTVPRPGTNDLEWTGDEAVTGYFDENPRVD